VPIPGVGIGGGGGSGGSGGSISPVSSQHACGAVVLSTTCSGVQENNTEVSIPIKSMELIFFIIKKFLLDLPVAVRVVSDLYLQKTLRYVIETSLYVFEKSGV
jgi:hypothetical protein